MSVSSWIRRQFKNGVSVLDTVPAGFTSGATSFVAADGSTFPDGSVGPFIITADEGQATEEKILIQSRSGSTFTIAAGGRGYNGGTAFNHGAGTTIFHTIDQQDLDEANQVAVATLGAISATGDLLVGTGSHALGKLAVGAANTFLTSNGTTLAYVGFAVGATQPVTSGNVDGTSNNPARADHSHSGVHTVNGVAGAVTFSNGYGITAINGANPTPAVALTSAAGHLASDTLVPNSMTTIFSTASLAAGTWLVNMNCTIDLGRTVLEACSVQAVLGTATATLEGCQSGSASVIVTGSNNDAYANIALSFIATVSVAGTLSFQALSSINNGATIKATDSNADIHATGYTAVRIA